MINKQNCKITQMNTKSKMITIRIINMINKGNIQDKKIT